MMACGCFALQGHDPCDLAAELNHRLLLTYAIMVEVSSVNVIGPA